MAKVEYQELHGKGALDGLLSSYRFNYESMNNFKRNVNDVKKNILHIMQEENIYSYMSLDNICVARVEDKIVSIGYYKKL